MTQKSVFEFKLMRSMPGAVIDICRPKAGSPRSKNQVFATDKKVDKTGKVNGDRRLDKKVDRKKAKAKAEAEVDEADKLIKSVETRKQQKTS